MHIYYILFTLKGQIIYFAQEYISKTLFLYSSRYEISEYKYCKEFVQIYIQIITTFIHFKQAETSKRRVRDKQEISKRQARDETSKSLARDKQKKQETGKRLAREAENVRKCWREIDRA